MKKEKEEEIRKFAVPYATEIYTLKRLLSRIEKEIQQYEKSTSK